MAAGSLMRRVYLPEFLKTLTADEKNEEVRTDLVEVIGCAAYGLPLPPPWTEEVDSRGIVYFWNGLRAEASWTHPMLRTFQETLLAAARITQSASSMESATLAISAYLKQAEAQAMQSLRGWTGPHHVYRPEGDDRNSEFFFNQVTGESSWENPLEMPRYELQAQFQLLVRFLQYLNDRRINQEPEVLTPDFHKMSAGLECIEEGGAGILECVVSSCDLPDEMQEYVKWIRLSLAAALPSANLESALESKRPALPPLTSMHLGGSPAIDGADAFRRYTMAPSPVPAHSASSIAQDYYASGRHAFPLQKTAGRRQGLAGMRSTTGFHGVSAVRRRTSLPPLTALPLNRTLPSFRSGSTERLLPPPRQPPPLERGMTTSSLFRNVDPLYIAMSTS